MRTRIETVAAGLLTAGLVALAGLAAPALAAEEPFGRLEVAEVAAMLGRKDVMIFDVNSADFYAKGHVPGARWSAMSDVEKNLPADRLLTLVYYCHNQR